MQGRHIEPRVELFVARVADVTEERRAEHLGWLTPEERAANERHAGDANQREHLLTRALSRWALSRSTLSRTPIGNEPPVAPYEWRFERTEAGRPFVVGPRDAPSFNLSNADGLVVCALAHGGGVVGVDVEPLVRGDELVASASKLFSPRENEHLRSLPPAAQSLRAVELWTVKEAYLKARGEGISVRLSRFSVAPDAANDETPRRYLLEDVHLLQDDPSEWHLEVRRFEGWIIAVAVHDEPSSPSKPSGRPCVLPARSSLPIAFFEVVPSGIVLENPP